MTLCRKEGLGVFLSEKEKQTELLLMILFYSGLILLALFPEWFLSILMYLEGL